jgi:hypothetical protein
MATENVINIDDARELREMGLPILPVVDKEFSGPATKLIMEAKKAKAKFVETFEGYCRATPTKQRFIRMQKALAKIDDISSRAADFTSPDEYEVAALQALLTKKMTTFVAYWRPILASVEEGEAVTITITREMLDEWAF